MKQRVFTIKCQGNTFCQFAISKYRDLCSLYTLDCVKNVIKNNAIIAIYLVVRILRLIYTVCGVHNKFLYIFLRVSFSPFHYVHVADSLQRVEQWFSPWRHGRVESRREKKSTFLHVSWQFYIHRAGKWYNLLVAWAK